MLKILAILISVWHWRPGHRTLMSQGYREPFSLVKIPVYKHASLIHHETNEFCVRYQRPTFDSKKSILGSYQLHVVCGSRTSEFLQHVFLHHNNSLLLNTEAPLVLEWLTLKVDSNLFYNRAPTAPLCTRFEIIQDVMSLPWWKVLKGELFTDWVDISPVFFLLWVLQRITVYLGGRC